MVMMSSSSINLEEGTWCEPQADRQREMLQSTKVSLDIVLQHIEGQGISVYSVRGDEWVQPTRIVLDSGSEANMCSEEQANTLGWTFSRCPRLTIRTADNKDVPVLGLTAHQEIVLNQGSDTEERLMIPFMVMDVKHMYGLLLSKTIAGQVGGWVDYPSQTFYFRHDYVEGACQGKLGKIPLRTQRRL